MYAHGDGDVHVSTTKVYVDSRPAERVSELAPVVHGEPGVFLSAATVRPGVRERIKDSDALQLTFLWAECDRDGEPGHKGDDLWTRRDFDKLLTSFPFDLAPSLVMDSGGGWWLFWFLAEPVDLGDGSEGETLLRRWQEHWRQIASRFGRRVDSVFNPGRIVRALGSLNDKEGGARPTAVVSFTPSLRYGLDDLDEWLPAPVAPTPSVSPALSDGTRPGDEYNRKATPELVRDLLLDAGFHSPKAVHGGRIDLTRPGKDARDGHSVTVWPDASVTFWSSDASALPGAVKLRDGASGTYDPFGLVAHLQHDGDLEAAAKALAAQGFGERQPIVTVDAIVGESSPGARLSVPTLPDEFYEARPILGQIRESAHYAILSAAAVTQIVLARVAVASDHRLRIPPFVGGRHAPLGSFVVVAGAPETGKSAAAAFASRLLPFDLTRGDTDDRLKAATEAGFLECFFPPGESKQRLQTVTRLFGYVDEGAAMDAVRKGQNSPWEQLRTAWSGGDLGTTLASAKRDVPWHNYVVSLVIGYQPKNLGNFFEQAGSGDVGRFALVPATDPTIPDGLERRSIQGLEWRKPGRGQATSRTEMVGGAMVTLMDFPSEVEQEIRDRHLRRQRDELEYNDASAHRYLRRAKHAGCLALLDGRFHVNPEDWALADMLCDLTTQTYEWAQSILIEESRRKRKASNLREAERQVTVYESVAKAQEAREVRRVVDGAKWLSAKVWDSDREWTRRELQQAASVYREVFKSCLEHAEAEGWLVEEEEPGSGRAKKVMRRGEVRPPS